ncbi:hypothetical protein SMJ63A_140046 [Stenotrophomonas geniculata]
MRGTAVACGTGGGRNRQQFITTCLTTFGDARKINQSMESRGLACVTVLRPRSSSRKDCNP